MLAFLFRRLGQSLLVIAVMATLVFVGVYALGNPIDILISPDADQIERERAIERLGLDQPLWVQFWLFVKSALAGDLGRSFVHGVPAIDLILSRMPATLELAFVALVLAVGIGIPLGLLAGLAPQSLAGRGIMTGSIIGFSLPNFWLGLMLILLFAVELKILPAGGRGETRAAVRHRVVVPDARRASPPDPAGADARDLQGLAGDPARLCRHARGAAAGLRAVRARQGPARRRASSASTCSRSS